MMSMITSTASYFDLEAVDEESYASRAARRNIGPVGGYCTSLPCVGVLATRYRFITRDKAQDTCTICGHYLVWLTDEKAAALDRIKIARNRSR